MEHTGYRHRLEPLTGSECVFPEAELQRRRDAVRQAMQAAEVEALLLTAPADIFYLTGYSTFEVSVHTALVVTLDHLMLQVPSIEVGPAVTCTRVDDIRSYRWENLAEVIEPLAEVLAMATVRIGIDPWHGSLRQGVLAALRERLPGREFVDAADLLHGVKLVKSPLELDYLGESARITGTGIAAAAEAVRAGATDSEIAATGARAMHEAGSEFMSMQPIVVAGARSSVGHLNHRRRPVGIDESVFMEFGSAWNRYTAPMMRTVVAGRPSARMIEVFDTCRRIYDALLGAMRPGRSFESAARAAEQAFAPLSDDAYISGVYGYAVGAQFPPSWVEGSGFIARGQTRCFAPDMVFHLPICLRLPGQWGIGCSDTVRVTETGGVALTANPWSLGVDA
ncbi:M24 family metallopeptidase [Modicisalibacter coralii]|uniref:M24 family metallopeptidase n=1 Tax=Modicisalibacter coralii TaxID=2304602 RepID=UPI00100BCAD1|nr:Xaa-Pro peptidase family protein [Halomonas coralii]